MVSFFFLSLGLFFFLSAPTSLLICMDTYSRWLRRVLLRKLIKMEGKVVKGNLACEEKMWIREKEAMIVWLRYCSLFYVFFI